METYLVKSKSELRIEAGVKVDTLIGIVEDIKTIVLQLKTEWGDIDREYKEQSISFKNERKREYAHKIVSEQKAALFDSMGSEMSKIKRSIGETNNTKLMAEVAKIPLEPLSEFYNMTIGYFEDFGEICYYFGGVLEALMCIREIKESYTEYSHEILTRISKECSVRYEYACNYLSGTDRFEGSDYIGTTTSTDDLLKRYKLLHECATEIEKQAIFIDGFKDYCCDIQNFYSLYEETQEEYKLYQKLQSYSIDEEAQVTPPNQSLNVFFDCTNFDYLNAILNREVRGNGGRQLAVVLFALAEIGYKVKPRKLKPLFETILKPQYGVVGSLQAVTKYNCKEYDNDFTEEVDTLAAEFREELQKL